MLSDDLCSLYPELPVSVLIFEEETLVHINKYLYDIFSVDELVVELDKIKNELY